MKEKFTKEDTWVVKGFAILCMLTYHLFEHYERVTMMAVDFRPFPMETFLMLTGFGNICVAVFAFLSAYGITKGLKTGSPEQLKPRTVYLGAGKRCMRLIANFMVMFISVNVLWFYKFDYQGLYGKGWQGLMFGGLDMLGLAQLCKTPTLNATWWYMELAILIVFAVPLLFYGVRKLGAVILIPGLLLPAVFTLNPDVQRYYFVVLLGVVAAHEDWLEKLFSWKAALPLKYLTGIVLLAGCVLFRQNYAVYNLFAWVIDGPIALLCVWCGGELLSRIPLVRPVLSFLGKHSMNIYFIHTFFYMSIYQSFIYSFRHAGLILLVLTGVCLIYSVILEGIKRLIGLKKGKAWG